MKDITIEEATQIMRNHICWIENKTVKQAIEKVLDELENEKEYHQWDAEKLQDYHKENSELNTKCVQLEYQLEKKDKMINAMALQLSGISIWDDKKEEPLILMTEEDVKKYFERTVADERRNDQKIN